MAYGDGNNSTSHTHTHIETPSNVTWGGSFFAIMVMYEWNPLQDIRFICVSAVCVDKKCRR